MNPPEVTAAAIIKLVIDDLEERGWSSLGTEQLERRIVELLTPSAGAEPVTLEVVSEIIAIFREHWVRTGTAIRAEDAATVRHELLGRLAARREPLGIPRKEAP